MKEGEDDVVDLLNTPTTYCPPPLRVCRVVASRTYINHLHVIFSQDVQVAYESFITDCGCMLRGCPLRGINKKSNSIFIIEFKKNHSPTIYPSLAVVIILYTIRSSLIAIELKFILGS